MIQPRLAMKRQRRLHVVRRGPADLAAGVNRQRMPIRVVPLHFFAQHGEIVWRPTAVPEGVLVFAAQAPDCVERAVTHRAVGALPPRVRRRKDAVVSLSPPRRWNGRHEPAVPQRPHAQVEPVKVGRVQLLAADVAIRFAPLVALAGRIRVVAVAMKILQQNRRESFCLAVSQVLEERAVLVGAQSAPRRVAGPQRVSQQQQRRPIRILKVAMIRCDPNLPVQVRIRRHLLRRRCDDFDHTRMLRQAGIVGLGFAISRVRVGAKRPARPSGDRHPNRFRRSANLLRLRAGRRLAPGTPTRDALARRSGQFHGAATAATPRPPSPWSPPTTGREGRQSAIDSRAPLSSSGFKVWVGGKNYHGIVCRHGLPGNKYWRSVAGNLGGRREKPGRFTTKSTKGTKRVIG